AADPGAVADLLTEDTAGGVEGMRRIQHDVAAEAYVPYRDLAVAALTGRDEPLAALLASWDGTARARSTAFAAVVRLREILAGKVLAPYLAGCRELDPRFRYAFRSIDRPLLAILATEDPALLPPDEQALGWPEFLARCARQAVQELRAAHPRRALPRWGRINTVGLHHPLSGLAPWSGPLLNAKPRPQPGAIHCVRTCVPGFGAAGRAVMSPGAIDTAVFETPGGQSAHPLSAHFVDRHRAWAAPAPEPVRRRTGLCFSVLEPADRSAVAGKETRGTRRPF
ncbi:penicillin acylase family protein, partial [Streptomyces hyaluromycini]